MGRAGGLRSRRDGAELQARTGRGVVLCGGAVGSPHLLLLSGIGPPLTCARTLLTTIPIFAIGTFATGTDAFIIAGLLPSIVDALDTSWRPGRW
jgi:GMC oxidoreductase